MGWEGLHQVALTSRKHAPGLWHSTVCVKPNKHDFKVCSQDVLNNLYLPVIIYIFLDHPTTRLKYKLFRLTNFIKDFKHIHQLPLVIDNQGFCRNL